MKNLLALLAAGLLIGTASQAVASIQNVTYTQTANNAVWPSVPSGYNNQSFANLVNNGNPVYGYYDAFKVNVSGTPNANVSSIRMAFRFGGYFDDSVGVDLNGNGTIDYALNYFDIAASASAGGKSFAPWSSLQDAGNLGIVMDITSSGTTAQAYIYGSPISITGRSLNNLSGMTLASLGFGPLDANGDDSSTGSVRIGFLNTDGGGGGTPDLGPLSFNYDPTVTYSGALGSTGGGDPVGSGDGGTSPVPEPSQVAASILLMAGIAGFVIVRRKKAAIAA